MGTTHLVSEHIVPSFGMADAIDRFGQLRAVVSWRLRQWCNTGSIYILALAAMLFIFIVIKLKDRKPKHKRRSVRVAESKGDELRTPGGMSAASNSTSSPYHTSRNSPKQSQNTIRAGNTPQALWNPNERYLPKLNEPVRPRAR